MDLDAAIATLNRIRQAEGHGRRELAVVIHAPGSLGGTPSVPVARIDAGFDWDHTQLLLTPGQPLTALQPDQVQAITKSVASGQSWHAYEAQRALRVDLDRERTRGQRLAALLREVAALYTRDDELPNNLLPRIAEAL